LPIRVTEIGRESVEGGKMAVKPEMKPITRLAKEPLAEISEKTAAAEAARTIATPQAMAENLKAATKPVKPKIRKGKLQLVVPLLVIWKLRIAAAQELTSPGKLLLSWIQEPLKAYTYPPIPEKLKKRGVSEDEAKAAA
jgi:hypothetical protein